MFNDLDTINEYVSTDPLHASLSSTVDSNTDNKLIVDLSTIVPDLVSSGEFTLSCDDTSGGVTDGQKRFQVSSTCTGFDAADV